jgi:hypothetical protein
MQNAQLLAGKAGGTYSYQSALKGNHIFKFKTTSDWMVLTVY